MADTDQVLLDQPGTEPSELEVAEQTLTTGQLEGETPKPEAEKKPEIDWAIEGPKERDARIKSDAARIKVENDLKSLKAGRQRDFDRDASIRRTEEKAEETAQTTRMILENLKPLLDPEAVARIDAAQAASTQTQQRQGFENFRSEYAAKIAEIAESQGVDPNTHEAYAGVRTQFSTAVAQGDREGILRATLSARELGNILKPAAVVEKKGAAPKAVMTDLGPGVGGVGRSPNWAQAQKIKSESDLSDEAYEKLVAAG